MCSKPEVGSNPSKPIQRQEWDLDEKMNFTEEDFVVRIFYRFNIILVFKKYKQSS